MFDQRSQEPERIDTGDYTQAEYETFLREIAFINRYLGDRRALRRSLLDGIERDDVREFSVLDVGCGSGELLRTIAVFARGTGRRVSLTGVDLNPISSIATQEWSREFPEIWSVRGDALALPFADGSFDYAISSLFFHHLSDDRCVTVLEEMSRVVRNGVVVIDLRRHWLAYRLYRLFCFVFRISPLVLQDGSLSIRKGFVTADLRDLARRAGAQPFSVSRIFPFRLVLTCRAGGNRGRRV